MHIDPNKYQLKIKQEGEQTFVWDPIRKKYLSFTPEEMVRQYLICYLVEDCNYPLALISVEKGLNINGLAKRYDMVIYNRSGVPRILIECKAPTIKLTDDVFAQASRYNLQLKVEYLMISNGPQNYIAKVDIESGKIEMLEELPNFEDLQ